MMRADLQGMGRLRFTPSRWVGWLGILLGGGFWLLDSFVDAVLFQEGSVMSQIIHPSPVEIWVRSTHFVILAAAGVLIKHILDQRAKLLEALQSYQRAVAISSLASGVAHEISNPLAFVRANMSQLQDHWAKMTQAAANADEFAALNMPAAEGAELIDESLDGIDRIAVIVREVESLGTRRSRRQGYVDMNELVPIAANFANGRPGSLPIDVDTSPVPPIWGNGDQLQQVFLNLLSNAVQAAGENGTIRVVTEAAGPEVIVRIEDDGAGIDPAVMGRIFDPFFTTKPPGEGTGLGLAISAEIVRQHGGSISVESDPGNGTTFTVRLPARTA
jgi:two-component system NtrC family sensor kinase